MHRPSIATLAGIRQAYQCHQRTEHMRSCDRDAIRGLTYIHTDKGPTRQWLHQIGRALDPFCNCGAIHKRSSPHDMHETRGWTREAAKRGMERSGVVRGSDNLAEVIPLNYRL